MRLIRVLLTGLVLRAALGVALVLSVAYPFLPDRTGRGSVEDLKQELERLPSTLSEIDRILRSRP